MKLIRIILVLIIVIVLAIGINLPVGATPVIHEYYNTNGDADSVTIYGSHWVGEQFTSEATAHTITSVRLLLKKFGTPDTFKVSIYNAAAGVPTSEITSVTYYCTTLSTTYAFYDIDIPDISLNPSTQYAIVVSCLSGDASNYVMWYKDSDGGLANAIGSDSSDSGVSWVNDAGGADYLFEVYGEVVFQVVGAIVCEDYLVDGDWLIAIECKNSYPEYVNTTDVSRYFNVQMLDPTGTTVLAATTLKSWGYSPCGIYLSPTSVIPLTSGSAYIIRMIGTFTGTPYTQYTLTTDDWVGSDLRYLDQWCLTVAKSMNTYDNNTTTQPYTTYVSGVGELLTTFGGGKFTNGIPSIMYVRPDIFETSQHTPDYETGTATNAYDTAHTWQNQVGTIIEGDATVFGTVLGVSAKQFLTLGIWVIYTFCMLFVFASKGGAETIFVMIICLPVLLIGLNFRIIEIQVFTVACAFAVLLFVVKMWFTK